jgi:superkiller protein 3
MEPQVAAKVQEFREAVIAQPESHEAWGRLGTVLHAHEFEKEAATCYEQAIALDPAPFRWHHLLTYALRGKDNARALSHADRASELRPRYSPTYVVQAEILEADNQPERALEKYAQALAVDPGCTPAEFGLGRLYLAKGDLKNSLSHLQRAAELEADAAAIHSVLTLVYRRLGEEEAALKEARLASELTGQIVLNDPVYFQMRRESVSSLSLLRRAIIAEEAGAYQQAEALYRRLLEIRPDDANMRVNLGNTLAQQDKLQAAKDQYHLVLTVEPDNASALFGLGNVLSSEGNLGEAVTSYRDALKTRPAHLPTLLYLSRVLAFQGHLEQASIHLRRAVEIDPRSFDARRELGEVLLQQGATREAITHLQAAVEQRPSSGPVHVQLAMAWARVGDDRAAWEHVERARELGVTAPPELVEELRRRDPTHP